MHACPLCKRDSLDVACGIVHMMFFHGTVYSPGVPLHVDTLRTMQTSDGPVYWVDDHNGWTSLPVI